MPPHPGKLRVFRALSRFLLPNGLRVRDGLGARLLVDPLDYIGHAICFAGAFEPLSLELARELMKDGGTFLDVGSNFGLYTCSLSRLPGVKCIAVDASARAFAKLQDNLALNQGGDVTAVNVALGATRALTVLEAPEDGNLGTTRVSKQIRSLDRSESLVSVIPMQELLSAARVTSIRLMKIDVEGFEFEVFRGMDLLRGVLPDNVLMEYSTAVGDAGALRASCDLLCGVGYEARTVTGQRFDGTQVLIEENLWWKRETEMRRQEPVT